MLPYYHADGPRPDKWSEFEPFSAYRDADFKASRDTRAYAPRERYIERRGYYDDGPRVGVGVAPGVGVSVGIGGGRW